MSADPASTRTSMRLILWLTPLCLLAAACASIPAAPHGHAGPYRILVTNDDGIDAPGLAALAGALKPLGEVVVMAPSSDRSGASHSITLLRGIPSVTKVMRDGALFGYAVDGTPADCVLLAIYWLKNERPFDLVVS